MKRGIWRAAAATAGLILTMAATASAQLSVTPSASYDAAAKKWTLTSGSYEVSGTADADESVVVSGNNVTVTLNGVTIEHAALGNSATLDALKTTTPAIDVQGSGAKMILKGQNSVKGSTGCAGVHVAEKASLVISGSGSLTAVGGDGHGSVSGGSAFEGASSVYFGGAAGVGGNGDWIGENGTLGNHNAEFGTVEIQSGNVTAKGGKEVEDNAAAGAGIGSGGLSLVDYKDGFENGIIKITGGVVEATGGAGNSDNIGGGAGIGSGGASGGYYSADSSIQVIITAGTVTANGGAEAAGIGGGCNVNNGTVEISGGNVTATGAWGDSGSSWGGAGIGGGDQSDGGIIHISGGKVTASATGAAAGIGGGKNAGVKEIIINGTADVTAYGGSPSSNRGGAGIGTGDGEVSKTKRSGFETIAIGGKAKVRAYAGPGAQAVGMGSRNSDNVNPYSKTLRFDSSSIDVWMFNRDTTTSAFWGQNDGSYTHNGVNLIWNENLPGENAQGAAKDSNGAALAWKYSGQTITVTKDGQEVASETYEKGFKLGNWATVERKTQTDHEVKIDADGGAGGSGSQTVSDGATITIKAPNKEGYDFKGWKDQNGNILQPDANGEVKITVMEDMRLTAVWKIKTFSISFIVPGSTKTSTLEYGQKLTLSEEKRDGYRFMGWTDGNNMYQPGDTITVKSNLTLTAIWEKLPSAADLPKTGDESPALLWGAALAAAAAVGFMLKRKK